MSRKIWVHTYGKDFYPNLYIFLVGPPASGKTVPIDIIREDIWKKLPEYFVAPKSITAAALTDTLVESKHKILRPTASPPYIEFNSLAIFSPELGTFMSAYDNELMQRLQDLYDCTSYEERRRGKDLKVVIPNVQLNILAGCTPSFLNELLPQGAWDQGFISRTIMIFAGEGIIGDLFFTPPTSGALHDALVQDLKTISSLYGKMEWEPEAATRMQAWNKAGGPPAPDHIRLTHYNSRRTGHLLKLCMVASVSRANDLLITVNDFELALAWLTEAEILMPEIFKAMKGATTDGSAIDEAWYFCWSVWTKEKRAVPEFRLVQFLQQRVPNYSVMNIIELMQRSNMIRAITADKRGNLYEPVPKGSHES